jgi:hypothetical protein
LPFLAGTIQYKANESFAEYKLVNVADYEEGGTHPRTIKRPVDPAEHQVDISDFL